jgi:hypothetical protein
MLFACVHQSRSIAPEVALAGIPAGFSTRMRILKLIASFASNPPDLHVAHAPAIEKNPLEPGI